MPQSQQIGSFRKKCLRTSTIVHSLGCVEGRSTWLCRLRLRKLWLRLIRCCFKQASRFLSKIQNLFSKIWWIIRSKNVHLWWRISLVGFCSSWLFSNFIFILTHVIWRFSKPFNIPKKSMGITITKKLFCLGKMEWKTMQ